MPPKRKKSVRQKQKQRQSQSQRVTINIAKTTKRRRNAGRGGLPPPSHLQNLFPPTIIQQQAPNIAVLENQISRLTSLIQEPTGIKQPTTPLTLETRAKTAEAQKMAGEQAEARRPGPTAGNFQPMPSVAKDTQESREVVSEVIRDIENRVIAEVQSRQAVAGVMSDIIDRVVAQNPLRPADNYYRQQLVNPADPPKMAGLGEGGGGLPFADARRAPPGRPLKDTQRAVPVSPSTAPPIKDPISKRDKRDKAEEPPKKPSAKAKILKQAAEQPGQQRLDPSTFSSII